MIVLLILNAPIVFLLKGWFINAFPIVRLVIGLLKNAPAPIVVTESSTTTEVSWLPCVTANKGTRGQSRVHIR